MRVTKLEAVILDVDGTLVDSNDAHAHSWVEAFAACGYDVPFARVRPLIGMGGDKLLPAAVGVQKESPEGKRITEKRQSIFMQKYLPALRPFPGTKALLHHLHEAGLRLVVASSANEEELQSLLQVTGAPQLFDEQTSSSQAPSSKPDPDVVQAALQRCRCPREAVVMAGDTPYDVDAGARAGIPVIGVRCGGWDDTALRGAIAVYDGPEDLLRHWDEAALAATGAGVE